LKISLDQNLLERASELAKAFALKAYDGLHLAAANLFIKAPKRISMNKHNLEGSILIFSFENKDGYFQYN